MKTSQNNSKSLWLTAMAMFFLCSAVWADSLTKRYYHNKIISVGLQDAAQVKLYQHDVYRDSKRLVGSFVLPKGKHNLSVAEAGFYSVATIDLKPKEKRFSVDKKNIQKAKLAELIRRVEKQDELERATALVSQR